MPRFTPCHTNFTPTITEFPPSASRSMPHSHSHFTSYHSTVPPLFGRHLPPSLFVTCTTLSLLPSRISFPHSFPWLTHHKWQSPPAHERAQTLIYATKTVYAHTLWFIRNEGVHFCSPFHLFHLVVLWAPGPLG